MKVKFLNYRFRFDVSLQKLTTVTGVNSNLCKDCVGCDTPHILLWDFDDIPLDTIKSGLNWLQTFWRLSNIYIIQSSEGKYHAYCFMPFSYPVVLHILADTPHIDMTYFKLGVVRGYWTLRITPKKPYQKFVKVAVLTSDIPEINVRDLDIVQYVTGV